MKAKKSQNTPAPDHNIDVATMLFLRYKKPIVALNEIIADYLPHLNADTARKKANAQRLPFPTFQTDKSSQAEYFVNLSDLAVWLEKAREQARQDWQAMNV